MCIATTINLRDDTSAKIANLAIASGLTKRDVLRWFLLQMVRHEQKYLCFMSSIKYQKPKDGYEFRNMYIEYSDEEYEILLDLRKICKMSVSLIAFLSFQYFYDEFLKLFCSKSSKHILKTYNYISFKYSWEFTEVKGLRKLVLIRETEGG